MDELENKLGAILNNPDMMQKIMSLAQNLGAKESPTPQQAAGPVPGFPDIDLSMIQKLSGLAQKSNIDQNQRSLLKALSPYLSNNRISRLERAMHAAKIAGFATTLFGTGR